MRGIKSSFPVKQNLPTARLRVAEPGPREEIDPTSLSLSIKRVGLGQQGCIHGQCYPNPSPLQSCPCVSCPNHCCVGSQCLLRWCHLRVPIRRTFMQTLNRGASESSLHSASTMQNAGDTGTSPQSLTKILESDALQNSEFLRF